MPDTMSSRMSVVETTVASHDVKIHSNEKTVGHLVRVTAQLAVTMKVLAWMFGLSFPVVLTGFIYLAMTGMT